MFAAADVQYLPGGGARAALVRSMSGRYRLPDALRRADQLARGRPGID